MVDFDHRGQRALAKAGDGADGEFAVGGGERQLVGLAGFAGFVVAQAEIEADLGEQVAGAAGVAGGAAADADDVVALRIEIEERVEGGGAVDARRGNAGFVGDVAQRFHGEEFVRVGGLDGFQDSQQRAGAVAMFGDDLIDEQFFVRVESLRRQRDWRRLT